MEVYAEETQPEVINVESQSQETQSQGIIEETQLTDTPPGPSETKDQSEKNMDIEVKYN